MSANANCSLIKDVKPYKTGWTVRVKMLHSWKQNFGGESLEFILVDETVRINCLFYLFQFIFPEYIKIMCYSCCRVVRFMVPPSEVKCFECSVAYLLENGDFSRTSQYPKLVASIVQRNCNTR